ncbi:MAG TPA: hypothetical protein VGF29_17265 [Hyphomicrobiaceae bacterium]|jgi:hypothetical protein
MGIEKLNSAAWAAGFAMAASEDAFEDAVRLTEATAEGQWRPGEAVLVRESSADRADWIKALFGYLHLRRRAPVSTA